MKRVMEKEKNERKREKEEVKGMKDADLYLDGHIIISLWLISVTPGCFSGMTQCCLLLLQYLHAVQSHKHRSRGISSSRDILTAYLSALDDL